MVRGKLSKEERIAKSEQWTDPERRAFTDKVRKEMEENPHLKQKFFSEKYGIGQMELSRIKNYRDSYNPFKIGVLKAQIGDEQGNEYEMVEHFIEEMRDLWLKIKNLDPRQVIVKGDTISQPLTYFDFYKTGDMVNMIINLYYTLNLNSSETATIISPAGNIEIWD